MAMKTSYGKRVLTFGELVAATFDAMGRRKARGLLRFAANTRLIFFQGGQPLVICNDQDEESTFKRGRP
jgi:hypothetical protein